MTSKKVLKTCDFCAKDIKSEIEYSLKVSQRPTVYKKGVLVKADKDADMCHECFMKICKNGYKPEWTTLVKDPVTEKWNEVDEQTKLNE